MTSPVSPEGQDNYRCPDRGGPDGQRCQLLIEHDPPVHLARIHGAYAGWDDDVAPKWPSCHPPRWLSASPGDED